MAGTIHLANKPAQRGQHYFGMDVAADGFLDALLRYATQEKLFCCAQDAAQFVDFKETASRWGVEPSRCVFIPLDSPERIADAGCLVLRDPNIAPFAQQRHSADARSFSLCGLSHSLSTAPVIAAITACNLEPTQPWDAIVCTSISARRTIEAVWQGWHDHHEAQLADHARENGLSPAESRRNGQLCPVDLPVIPLGINTEDFVIREEQAERLRLRSQLGIPEAAVFILAHGRHSYFSKAHPLPLFQAVEQIAEREKHPIHLALYGYFPTERIGEEFRSLAHDLCRKATIHFVENTNPDFSGGLWAAADIFVSLADNIQETFGLTPVEAMASGLPVIASDWNGYRETIRHETDGFLIPTTAPNSGMGEDLAYRYSADIDTYGHFIGGAAQTTAVDQGALTGALTTLVGDAGLRRRMGEAGKRHAQAQFDWRAIIPQHEALWRDLDQRRAAEHEADRETTPGPAHPYWPDPFTIFASHPTRRLTIDDRLESSVSSYDEVTALLRHRMNMFTPDILIAPEQLPTLIHAIMTQPGISIGTLAQVSSNGDEAQLQRSVGWLLKLGVIRLSDTEGAAGLKRTER